MAVSNCEHCRKITLELGTGSQAEVNATKEKQTI